MSHTVDEWYNLYREGWKGHIIPESFSHPAKVAYRLAERIYQHVRVEGWARPGDTVLDPFGGIAGFALHAMQSGLNFVGVELEPRFVDLACDRYACPGFTKAFWRRYHRRAARLNYRAFHLCPECLRALDAGASRTIPEHPAHIWRGNIGLWNSRYAGKLPTWGSAQILQGDSRRLLEVIARAGELTVSSPPFGSAPTGRGIASAMRGEQAYPMDHLPANVYQAAEHCATPGNLGSLPYVEEGFDNALGAAELKLGSPPYGNRTVHGQASIDLDKLNGHGTGANSMIDTMDRYGATPGNLGNLPIVDASFNNAAGAAQRKLSSPPYLGGGNHPDMMGAWNANGRGQGINRANAGYNLTNPQNLGSLRPSAEGLERMTGAAERQLGSPPFTTSDSRGASRMPDGYFIRQDGTPFGEGVSVRHTLGDNPANLGNMPACPAGLAAAISSPPYADGGASDITGAADTPAQRQSVETHRNGTQRHYGPDPANLGNLPVGDLAAAISSPPYADGCQREGNDLHPERLQGSGHSVVVDYHASNGNLASMSAASFALVLTSPPYAGRGEVLSTSCGIDWEKAKEGSKTGSTARDTFGQSYGATEGQLGAMPSGDFASAARAADARISSPPWEKGAEGKLRAEKFKDPAAFSEAMAARDGKGTRNGTTPASRLAQMERDAGQTYGDTPGNVGQIEGQDFWSAARQIVDQCYLALRPGGHAVWVVKSFVRNGQLVDFPDQWRRMCEAAGFITLHEHRAMLIEHRGSQANLDGEVEHRTVKRASFFRRLAEAKGSPAIDFETVYCMLKPENAV